MRLHSSASSKRKIKISCLPLDLKVMCAFSDEQNHLATELLSSLVGKGVNSRNLKGFFFAVVVYMLLLFSCLIDNRLNCHKRNLITNHHL